MIKKCAAASVLRTIRALRASSPSFALCQCGWMKDGIKFNLICQTLLAVHTVQTTLKPCACKYTLTVVFAASISPIAYIRKKSCPLSSNCFCPSNAKSKPLQPPPRSKNSNRYFRRASRRQLHVKNSTKHQRCLVTWCRAVDVSFGRGC